MGLFVSITRWTPEQDKAMSERFGTMLDGTAPKAVLDAFAKCKTIAEAYSPWNRLYINIAEVATDENWIDDSIATSYFQDVCTIEEYPALNLEQVLEARKRLSAKPPPK